MDIARSNIRHLMAGRSLNEVAEGSGIGQTWLQRYMNPDKPSGIRKANPEKLAQLAKFFGVTTAELMLQDLTTRPAAPSQPAGREREIVDAAVKLVRYLEEIAPDLASPETLASRLFFAMKIVEEEGAEGVLDGSRFVEATRQLAARLRAVG